MQVFYHLGELNDSLTYALGAGELFDVTDNSEFVQTLVGKRRRRPQCPALHHASITVC